MSSYLYSVTDLNPNYHYTPDGVLHDTLVAAQGTPNMTVQVSKGVLIVEGSPVVGAASSSLSIAAANATLDRYDAVVRTAAGTLAVRTGTPGLAFAPLQDGDIPQALVLVRAGTSSILSTDITDARNQAAPANLQTFPGTAATIFGWSPPAWAKYYQVVIIGGGGGGGGGASAGGANVCGGTGGGGGAYVARFGRVADLTLPVTVTGGLGGAGGAAGANGTGGGAMVFGDLNAFGGGLGLAGGGTTNKSGGGGGGMMNGGSAGQSPGNSWGGGQDTSVAQAAGIIGQGWTGGGARAGSAGQSADAGGGGGGGTSSAHAGWGGAFCGLGAGGGGGGGGQGAFAGGACQSSAGSAPFGNGGAAGGGTGAPGADSISGNGGLGGQGGGGNGAGAGGAGGNGGNYGGGGGGGGSGSTTGGAGGAGANGVCVVIAW